MTVDVKALRALALRAAHGPDVLPSYEARDEAGRRFRVAVCHDVVLARLDRLERAESAVARRDVVAGGGFERREPASREAGEIVDAVLRECGYDGPADRFDTDAAHTRADTIIQRAIDAAEERGAEAADEQCAIERRHGPDLRPWGPGK